MPEPSATTGHPAAPTAGAERTVGSDGAGGPDSADSTEGADSADGADGIGRRLTAHRVRRGLRVAELARSVGVTSSLISQIERGQTRPSVSTLFALAQSLDVPVDAFFRESPQAPQPPQRPQPTQPAQSPQGPQPDRGAARDGGRYLVRKADRAAIDIEGGVRWERLTRDTFDHLDFFELIYQPGAQSHPHQYTHPGTEMVLVMRGCLEITVGFERYRLEPGDSIDFPSSMPHRYVNPRDQAAHAVTVIFYDCPAGPDGAPGRSRPAF